MSVLTTIQKINVAKVSQYLAAQNASLGALFGPRKSPDAAKVIYMERKAVEWMYNLDPTNTTLPLTSNYLISLCRGYNLRALNIINNGGGGSVSPVIPTADIFPFIITSADFESDGISYNNSDIIWYDLSIFINEVSQSWMTTSSTTFVYTATGIQITVPGFDASLYSYTIMIQKLGSG